MKDKAHSHAPKSADAPRQRPARSAPRILVVDEDRDLRRLYAEAFGPAPFPARTTCVVSALPDPKMLIEIEGVASLAQ